MGRFEDIVERNRNPKRTESLTIGIGVAVFILIILGMMVFTNLGKPNFGEKKVEPGPPPSTVEKRLNDVPLR